jgi:hypothetical protein
MSFLVHILFSSVFTSSTYSYDWEGGAEVGLKLGAHWIGSAQSSEMKLNGNKWKATHCISPAQTPSAGIRTVPE